MLKIEPQLIAKISEKARTSERKRWNHNFHASYDDPLQRFLNAIEPDAYIRPHKHKNDIVEIFIIVRGRLLIIEFDDAGEICDTCLLDAHGGNFGLEIAGGIWHTTIALESNSVFYEVKRGPYNPLTAKEFAPWSPEENTDEAKGFNQRLLSHLA